MACFKKLPLYKTYEYKATTYTGNVMYLRIPLPKLFYIRITYILCTYSFVTKRKGYHILDRLQTLWRRRW